MKGGNKIIFAAMGSVFQFKEFAVDQQNCAMKINTDGVLIAAMSALVEPRRILDLGTGTGVIALMLAQKYAHCRVDAVEIDPLAAAQAELNFKLSPFADRLHLYAEDFRALDLDEQDSYDLIISNPPFYTRSLQAPDARKNLAKHSDEQFFHQLCAFAAQRLNDQGVLELIVPQSLADALVNQIFADHQLKLIKEVRISSFEGGEVIRCILTCAKAASTTALPSAVSREDFYIYQEKGVYAQAYKTLLKTYFLAF